MMCLEMFSVVGYEVVGLIGQGGIGDVYQARQLSTGATVAVKVLRDTGGEPASFHRLQRELEALTAIGGQSNVVRLLDVVDSESGPALVMEYAPGGSVAALMAERAAVLDTDEVVFIGEQVASALAAAHQHGIVHRDVKPQNLLIDGYGAVKLCDFGIAAITRSEQFHTRTTALSVRYASPEDLEQDADVGGPSDVYSLGATLLHLAHGSPPTLRERVQAWVPPQRHDPIEHELDVLIADCLQPDPTARPSASEVAQRLGDLAAQFSPRRRSLDAGSAVDHVLDHGQATPEATGSAGDGGAGGNDRHVGGVGVDLDSLVEPTSSEPQPLAPPTGSPDRSASWRKVAVVLGVLAVVVVGSWVWRGRTADEGDSNEAPARSIVPRVGDSAGLDEVQLPDVVNGQCLGVEPAATQAIVVPCDEVHDGEVLAVERVPVSLEGPFNAEQVDAAATAFCSAIPSPTVESGLAVLVVSPSAASWEAGDRRLVCILAAPQGRIAAHD